MIGHELNIVALFNSDSAGKEAEDGLRQTWITRYRGARAVTLRVGDALGMPDEGATIEDLFTEAYYMEKVRESHALKLKSKGLTTDAITLSGSGPVLPRLQQCFDKLKVDPDKRAVGKLIRRDLIQCKGVHFLPTGVAEKGEALLTALRDAFDTPDADTPDVDTPDVGTSAEETPPLANVGSDTLDTGSTASPIPD